MKVSFSIMAHPDRKEWVDGLLEEIPNAVAVYDEKGIEWDTGKRAWEAYDPKADWHVVIQDDALPCKKFPECVRKALKGCPEGPVSFYAGQPQPNYASVKLSIERAEAADKHWVAMNGPVWGVCIAVPTSMVPAMIEGADSNEEVNYDWKLAKFFTGLGLKCWTSVPSLVDHRVGPSLLDGPKMYERKAHKWIGRNATALKMNWDTGALYWLDSPEWKWVRTSDGYNCGQCGWSGTKLWEIINHVYHEHGLGKIDFVATAPESVTLIEKVADQMEPEALGDIVLIGKKGVRPTRAKRVLSRRPRRFTIVDNYTALRYVTGRNAWSMDNKVEING